MMFAVFRALSWPNIFAIHAKVTSIPAVTPPDVQQFPSTAYRTVFTQFTFGPIAVTACQYSLFVVARLPSSTPAAAATPAPLQTVIRYLSFGYAHATYATVHSIFEEG